MPPRWNTNLVWLLACITILPGGFGCQAREATKPAAAEKTASVLNAQPVSAPVAPKSNSPQPSDLDLLPKQAPPTASTKPAHAPGDPLAVLKDAPPLTNLGTRKQGVDWPGFLGPTGDSHSSEHGILTKWPAAGPRIVWQKRLGTSYGIGSISRGRFFQYDRHGDQARLSCLNAESGELLWEFEHPSDFEDMYGYNNGPRCSPVVDDERVYIYGAEGMLHCLRAVDGQLVWRVDTKKDFGVVDNFFGVGSTPVVEGELLLVQVGGSPESSQQVARGQLDRVESNGTCMVAFNKYTGEVKYKLGDDLASYSVPKLATIDGRRWCFMFARNGLLAFEPTRGTIDFHFPWRSKILESVNASTPVVVGNEVLVSETYGPGSCLLSVKPGEHAVVWQDSEKARSKSLQCHWNTPVYVDGYAYGSSGRHSENAELRCVEWKTGQVKWSQPQTSRSSLLYVDGHFVHLAEFGQLQLLKVNPEKFDLVADVVLRDATRVVGPLSPGELPPALLKPYCWAAPILSHGLLYVRGDDRLVCLELIPEKMTR